MLISLHPFGGDPRQPWQGSRRRRHSESEPDAGLPGRHRARRLKPSHAAAENGRESIPPKLRAVPWQQNGRLFRTDDNAGGCRCLQSRTAEVG